LRVFSY